MKENVEVVVKVGFDGREMSIMTTGIKNVSYSINAHGGNIDIYCLSIINIRNIIPNMDVKCILSEMRTCGYMKVHYLLSFI